MKKTMKAACVSAYGLEDVIEIKELEVPEIKEDEILVKVGYSSINYADHATLTGRPFLIRATTGFLKPKNPIIGMDIAGEVVGVGKAIRSFVAGDRVFGDLSMLGMGAYGQYVVVKEEAIVGLPKGFALDDAAGIPLAGVTALQGLRDIGKLSPGQKVLVNGASGGVGSFAVQIVKAMGAHVTAICRDDKVDKLTTLGPDKVINYSKEDVTKLGQTYDLIFDCAAYRPAKDYDPILSEKGIYICNGGSMKHLFKVMIFGKLMSRKDGKNYTNYLAKSNKEDLKTLAAYMEKGQLSTLIDKTYSLDKLEGAFERYVSRQVCGKIIIDLQD